MIVQVLAYESMGTLVLSIAVDDGPGTRLEFWRGSSTPIDRIGRGESVADLVALVGEAVLAACDQA
jgi:hypothetical protein